MRCLHRLFVFSTLAAAAPAVFAQAYAVAKAAPAQLAERTRIETRKWAKAIKNAGIQPE